MSVPSSPSKLSKKQSLSIISSSTLNQLNNNNPTTRNVFKPTKERIISESTGLIKFSLQKPSTTVDENIPFNNVDFKEQVKNNNDDKVDTNDSENFNKLPIHIPINQADILKAHQTMNTNTNAEDLLFQMASKQRTILDLTEQLKQAKEELSILEKQYQDLAYAESPELKEYSISSVPSSPLKAASTIRKSTSIMNMTLNTPKINTEQFTKTQKQVTDTFYQITSNLGSNNFISKSKNFFESSLNKNIQIGSEFLNSIFEKESNDENVSNDDDVSLDETTQAFDYSVDFDLDRLNKIDITKKLNGGRILQDLKELTEEQENNKINRVLSSLSESSEEDYGGDAEPFHEL